MYQFMPLININIQTLYIKNKVHNKTLNKEMDLKMWQKKQCMSGKFIMVTRLVLTSQIQ